MEKCTTCSAIWLSVIIGTTTGLLKTYPSDKNVTVGQHIVLPCQTDLSLPVYWYFNGHEIFYGGRVDKYYQDMFRVVSEEEGEYNLVIHSANKSYNGEYICGDDEGQGERRSARLLVTVPAAVTEAEPSELTGNDGIDQKLIGIIVGVVVCVVVIVTIVGILLYCRVREKCCFKRTDEENTPAEKKPMVEKKIDGGSTNTKEKELLLEPDEPTDSDNRKDNPLRNAEGEQAESAAQDKVDTTRTDFKSSTNTKEKELLLEPDEPTDSDNRKDNPLRNAEGEQAESDAQDKVDTAPTDFKKARSVFATPSKNSDGPMAQRAAGANAYPTPSHKDDVKATPNKPTATVPSVVPTDLARVDVTGQNKRDTTSSTHVKLFDDGSAVPMEAASDITQPTLTDLDHGLNSTADDSSDETKDETSNSRLGKIASPIPFTRTVGGSALNSSQLSKGEDAEQNAINPTSSEAVQPSDEGQNGSVNKTASSDDQTITSAPCNTPGETNQTSSPLNKGSEDNQQNSQRPSLGPKPSLKS